MKELLKQAKRPVIAKVTSCGVRSVMFDILLLYIVIDLRMVWMVSLISVMRGDGSKW